MNSKAPDGTPWGPLGEVLDAEWAFVRLPRGGEPLVVHVTTTTTPFKVWECRFAPVLDVAALQEQLVGAERACDKWGDLFRIATGGDVVYAANRMAAVIAATSPPCASPAKDLAVLVHYMERERQLAILRARPPVIRVDGADVQERLTAAEQRAEEAEAACAAMREALSDPRWDNGDFAFCSSSAALRRAALTSDAGRGWLSPAESEGLRRERDKAKASLQDAVKAEEAGLTLAARVVRERTDLARILAIVGTALDAGEAEPLIDVAKRVADERDAL